MNKSQANIWKLVIPAAVVGVLVLACTQPAPNPNTPPVTGISPTESTTPAEPPLSTGVVEDLIPAPWPVIEDGTIRYIPIRWIELHAPRHTECKRADGSSFRGPIPAVVPNAWRSSEWMNWMISEMNAVYAGTGIQFWLQSHEAYCTDIVAQFLRDNKGEPVPDQLDTPFLGAEVTGDISMLFPHADLSDLGLSESLRRERWIQRAVALYGDPHGMPVFVHSDFLHSTTPDFVPDGSSFLPYRSEDDKDLNHYVLPQHGYYPWDSPGLAFLFLSGITWAPGWEFEPEAVVGHEIGHALGNWHTLDFDRCIVERGGDAIFPDGSPYTWADHWDLAYVNTGAEIKGFESREQAQRWINPSNMNQLGRIDDRWNTIMDKDSGRMSVQLEYDPDLTFSSETQVPTVESGSVRLLQGLSFDFSYQHEGSPNNPPHTYSWQRNIMSYRYPEVYNPDPRIDAVNPYDYLAARFSQSQIELMQRQLQGSTPFKATDYGTIPAGKESRFASQFHLLGDGKTEDFVWYSNGQGTADVEPGSDMKDMIAFRAAPAGTRESEITPSKLIAGDFNGDGLTDLLRYDETGHRLRTFLWSRVEAQDGIHGVHHWDAETESETLLVPDGYVPAFAGDFDGNGADDLFFVQRGATTIHVAYFRNDPSCRSYLSCHSHSVAMEMGGIGGPVAVGDFDGRNGDDFLWASYSSGATYAHVVWSTAYGRFTDHSGYKVGDAEYIPYAGNFNGTGGDDVLWYNPSDVNEVVWWGAADGGDDEHQFACGPGASSNCVDVGWNVIGDSSRVTIGDFDGNGADDILIHTSHEPSIFFSNPGDHLSYGGNYVRLQVALRKSSEYLTAVGEFDDASGTNGRLGDDIYLYYHPTQPESPAVPPTAVPPIPTLSAGMEADTDRPGMDYKDFDLSEANPELCRSACLADPQCLAYTYVKPEIQDDSAHCWLKSGTPPAYPDACCVSGIKPATLITPSPTVEPTRESPRFPIRLTPTAQPVEEWNTYRRGDRGPTVFAIQYLLLAENYSLAVDGIFGPETEATVKSFQEAKDLSMDGIVGPNTWTALIQGHTVKNGNRGNDVRAVQYLLKNAYGYDIAVDGIFGPETEEAVTSFQTSRGLLVDGIVGPQTWKALIGDS